VSQQKMQDLLKVQHKASQEYVLNHPEPGSGETSEEHDHYEMELLSHVLHKHAHLLRKVFKFYCCIGHGANVKVGNGAFKAFVEDIRVVHGSHFCQASADICFIKASAIDNSPTRPATSTSHAASLLPITVEDEDEEEEESAAIDNDETKSEEPPSTPTSSERRTKRGDSSVKKPSRLSRKNKQDQDSPQDRKLRIEDEPSHNTNQHSNELSAPQFIESLLRLAHGRYAPVRRVHTSNSHNSQRRASSARRKRSVVAEATITATLAAQLEQLIQCHIIPHARLSDVDSFRKKLASVEVDAVFSKQREALRAMYMLAAKADGGSQFHSHINAKEFVQLLDSHRVLSGGLSRTTVANVFNNSQSESGIGIKGGGGSSAESMSSQLNFTEFKEALAACAQFKDPNPYLAFERVIENFLFQLLPKKQRKKGVRRESVADAINSAIAAQAASHHDALVAAEAKAGAAAATIE